MPRSQPTAVERVGAPRPRRLEELVRLPRKSPFCAELERALAAASGLHLLHSNLEPVPLRMTATTSEAGAYRFRKREPIDLRVSCRTRRIASSLLHELGHFVDHQLHCGPDTKNWASAVHPAFAPWRSAVGALPGVTLRDSAHVRRYFGSLRELWARTYAQTVLLRSADSELVLHLRELQFARDPYVWPEREFAPVAVEVERALERLGLTAFPLPLAA